MSTRDWEPPDALGAEHLIEGSGDRYARLLHEAARHIEELERGLMNLARLPVQAHAARLGLLHELLSRCGQGLSGELKVAAALRSAGVRDASADALPPWELPD